MIGQRSSESLNGWWDFLPVLTDEGKVFAPPGAIPSQGYLPSAVLVPGSWSRGANGDPRPNLAKPWEQWRVFDSYGYDPKWDTTTTAWYRRTFSVSPQAGRRLFLDFGGVLRRSWVFVNGQEVGQTTDAIMPAEFDITDAVKDGQNELVVYVTDYERNADGKTYVPTGSDQMNDQKGLWQDVYLHSRPDVYVEDVTIRTSTRRNEMELIVAVRNASAQSVRVIPRFDVTQVGAMFHCLNFCAEPVELAANELKTLTLTQPWSSYLPWSPRSPQLYMLSTNLCGQDGSLIDTRQDRFGFREVWVEGHRLMLNGEPIHLAGEWGHKHSFDSFRPEWVRQWYGMLKDCNMNYIRTHTFPHPRVLLELADEMGILVSLEAGWHFGTSFALDEERLWQGALQHVRNIIRRDKNHPSIILWSVGNEVRWSRNVPPIIKNVPRLRELYEELDPTRPPYHDGDSSLWDERTQHIISRHYGTECSGGSWWDRRAPLHVGEMGKWHYGQPIDNTVWGDDDVFASYRRCHEVIAQDAADIIEHGRANDVLCLFPWNLSGLDNWRPWPQERHFDWPDPSAPHVKPLRTAPYGCEFSWWEPQGKGYVPGVSFDIIRHAFRPIAVVVCERLAHRFDDQATAHTVSVVNDSGQTLAGSLRVTLYHGPDALWSETRDVSIANGYIEAFEFVVPPMATDQAVDGRIETVLEDRAQQYDRHDRPMRVVPAGQRNETWNVGLLAVYGDGSMQAILEAHGVSTHRIDSLTNLDAAQTPLLLIEKNAVQVGTSDNGHLDKFLRAGGRAVILEQQASILPQMQIDPKPAERAHIRGGRNDVLEGLGKNDLAFWGNDPYGHTQSDSWVVVNSFRKPTCGTTRVLVDCGWGDFGHGGLNWAALVETRVGEGIALACQLRITDKASSHPVAIGLLGRLLEYATRWQARPLLPVQVMGEEAADYLARLGAKVSAGESQLVIAQADALDEQSAGALARRVFQGATAVICGVTPATARILSAALPVHVQTVDLGTIYNLIRAKDDPALEGISNQETYWLDKAHYGPSDAVNRPLTQHLLRVSGPAEGVETLLASESESCWREFYTLGARAERLRMSVITHYLWNGPRESAAGMVRVRHGRGQVLLCQVPFVTDDYSKARVFWTHLLRNLGAASIAALTDGDATIASLKRSDGYPVTVQYIADPSNDLLAEIKKMATPREHRLPNHGLVSGFKWQVTQCPGGTLTLEPGVQRVTIVFQVHAGRPRLATPIGGGLPDPNLQTMLDMFGSGRVETYVNGLPHQPVELGAQAQATVADIDLQMEWNSILLVWQSEPGQQSLRLAFRNRQRQPEVEFDFHTPN